MGRSSGTDPQSLYPEIIAIPAGASLLVTPVPGQMSVLVKYFSGGSLSITNVVDATGSSNAIAQQYVFSASEALSFDSVGSFYLTATGSTSVAHMIRIRSSGTGNP